MIRRIKQYASLVVFAHTLFALPFALVGFTLACRAVLPSSVWLLLGQVLACMVTARNSAMSFNRYADRFIDARNERTRERELPSGRLSPRAVLLFFAVNALLFLACCLSINRLCFYLAFPALAVLCGYSYTKRFTWGCHFILGSALAMAPAGAYMAVAGVITPPALWLSLIVVFWVSGFDILYALPDEAHDRANGLCSIPQRFGRKRALLVSGGLHALTLPLLCLLGRSFHAGWGYWTAAAIFMCLLAYQHAILGVHNIYRLNRAFFSVNGIASVLFAGLIIIELLLA